MEDKLLSINEVARYLKIPKSTIYKLSQTGKIPSSKIGKQLRFRLSSIHDWLNSKEGEAQDLFLTASPNKIFPKTPAKNILLIDDDRLVLKTLSRLLERQGYNLVSAESAKDALKLAEKKRFDLVVVDIRMPEMDGIETIKRLRALNAKQKRPHIPEVVITGYMDPAAEKDAEKLGITDYIHKPFLISEFTKIITKKLAPPTSL